MRSTIFGIRTSPSIRGVYYAWRRWPGRKLRGTPALLLNSYMDKIVVLDCGGQYTHLIARKVRDLGVYSEILPVDCPPDALRGAKGFIISGGPSSAYDQDSPQIQPA